MALTFPTLPQIPIPIGDLPVSEISALIAVLFKSVFADPIHIKEITDAAPVKAVKHVHLLRSDVVRTLLQRYTMLVRNIQFFTAVKDDMEDYLRRLTVVQGIALRGPIRTLINNLKHNIQLERNKLFIIERSWDNEVYFLNYKRKRNGARVLEQRSRRSRRNKPFQRA